MVQKKKTEALEFKISDFDLGWFVGIIEGEGSIGYRYNKRTGYLCTELTVSSTDEDIIDKLDKIYPGKSKYVKKYTNHYKEQFVWAVTSRKGIRTILTKILPYMGKRRYEKMKEVINEFNKYEQ